MLDIRFIRENPLKVKDACQKKQIKADVDLLLKTDKKKREILQKLEKLRAQKNKASKKISQIKSKKEKNRIIAQMREIDKKSDSLEKNLKIIEKKFKKLILQLPNIPFDEVPSGRDESENVVLKKVGKIPCFGFKVRDHLELGEKLDIIDVKRAAKISGSRFGFLKKQGALLEIALINLAFDFLTKKGFIPIIPPIMLKEDMARGTGYFEAADRKEAYYIPDDKLFLAGTAEQPLVAMHTNEIFDEKELPKRYVGFSSCFRREAGSYGKDTRGILRVHQFDKVEMVIFSKPEESKKEHQFLLSLEEKLMQMLEIPYQVINICTGDLGLPAAAKYDIEAWAPSQNKYRETHSTSNCTDFQARRLNIRYRDRNGKLKLVHTLNGTALAIGRTIIFLLENKQQKDGSVKIPKVLQKYLNFKTIEPAK